MDRVERPLSPHLQVYRPQMTSVLSILHRATGVALSAGVVVLVFWLVALAGGSAAYDAAAAILGSGWLKICYAGWSFCFFYHLANGVRHLAWDIGLGFEMNQINASGWLVLIVASIATAAFVFAAIL
ncbi:MAG: succinate dehydrogenase, cytochrome b556 subunit [Gammaproteobacteria bacterium]